MEVEPEVQAILDRRLIAVKRNDVATLRKCADELEALGTDLTLALSVGTHGVIAEIQGDLPRAHEHFEQARREHRRLGYRRFEAGATLGLGNTYRQRGDLNMALELYHKAMEGFQQVEDGMGLAVAAVNISTVNRRLGNYPRAIELLQQAQQYFQDHHDDAGLAMIYGNLSGCYLDVGEYDLSSACLYKVLDLRTTINDPIGLARTYHGLGSLSAHMRDREAALEWYSQALELYRAQGDQYTAAMCLAHMGGQYNSMGRNTEAEDVLREGYVLAQQCNALPLVLQIATLLCDVYGSQGQLDKVDEILDRHAADWPQDEEYHPASLRIRGELCRERGQYEEAKALFEQVLEHHHRSGRRSQEASIHERLQLIAKLTGDFDLYLKHQEAEQEIEREIRSDSLKKKLAVQDKQREIESAQQEAEKHKALLYGALPREIADRMLAGEDVSGDHYDHAAVLFFDIVGFTHLSSTISASDVITFLDGIFLTCDRICAAHDVTKIKTIGDSYMAVAFPAPGAASCEERLAQVAREIQSQAFVSPTGDAIQFRIGLHSGPVVAGVIGSERLQYDVWGDTVNVASRMESTGDPGRIHVSEAFATAYQADLAERSAGEGGLLPRGTIEVKGRGSMHTWWLEGVA